MRTRRCGGRWRENKICHCDEGVSPKKQSFDLMKRLILFALNDMEGIGG
jgi:hypothetical protein